MIKAKNGKLVLEGGTMGLINEYGVITKAMIEMLEKDGDSKEGIKELLVGIVEFELLPLEEKKVKLREEVKTTLELLLKGFEEEKEAESNE